MKFKDYYKILGLETSRVSINEIKTAYRISAKKNHPDLNVGDKLAEERIKDINEAYRVLSVPASKRKYDRTWSTYHIRNKQKKLKSKESIFQIFLGNVDENTEKQENKEATRGEDVETEIDIQLDEAYFGTEKKISLKESSGKNRIISVTIPKGIQNGEKIRLIGQGKDGKNGGKNGDMYIKMNIQNNSKFRLEGMDLYTDLFLTPWEATLGARVNISTVDSQTKIYIPQGIQSGEKLRIPNKGYKNGEGARGDLVAEVKIVVPKSLTEQEKSLYEQLQKVSSFNPRT